MHKFIRGASPINLEKMEEKYHDWDPFVGTQEHVLLGDELYDRQEHYCAYCETSLANKSEGHIEHLERRSDNPRRAFDWSNMFFSCKKKDSCGRYKDDKLDPRQFNPADIIDPSKEDPLDFFRFDMNGGVQAKAGLDETRTRKARETIRVFNLDQSDRLRGIRFAIAQTIAGFLESNPDDDTIDSFFSSLGHPDCISVYKSLLDTERQQP